MTPHNAAHDIAPGARYEKPSGAAGHVPHAANDGMAPQLSRRLALRRIASTAFGAALALNLPQEALAQEAHATGLPGPWRSPLHAGARISERYGVRGDWAAGHHTGVDFAVPSGTPVYSVGTGTVVLANWSGAYGKAVTVRMRDGHYTIFGHLSRISVRVGERVHAGTRLGRSGATGRATGPHLHFEVRDRRVYGNDVNPLRYLAERGVRVTKRR